MKKLIRKLINIFGFDLIKIRYNPKAKGVPLDLDEPVKELIQRVRAFTMTSPERIASLHQAIQYLTKNKIEGAIVECGVWKGGSTMSALITLVANNDTTRPVFLFDTFEGMSAPTEADKAYTGQSAAELMQTSDRMDQGSIWCFSTLEEVQENIKSTGYPMEKVQFVKGKVEDSIPGILPGQIALLRLDTDFYESTRHELVHLFPLLVTGGVLIIDDYGHWEGARKAVDEYMENHKIKILLNRIDYTGRIAIKIQ